METQLKVRKYFKLRQPLMFTFWIFEMLKFFIEIIYSQDFIFGITNYDEENIGLNSRSSDSDLPQCFDIYDQERQQADCDVFSISCLVMTWGCKEPGHQQA